MAHMLVTGATGFVGSWITRTLIDAGHTVRVLHRETSKLDAIADLDVEHTIGELDDMTALLAALQGIDIVFHVAAIAAYWRNNKAQIYKVNVDGTHTLLKACEQSGIKRFIFTSSAATVGFETDGRPLDETHVFNVDPDLWPYGHSKYLAEAEVYKAIQRGLDCVILNPSVILGPGDLNLISGSLVIEMAKGRAPVMPASGGITVIDVRDVAMAHLRAAEVGKTGERYILGTVDISNQALFKLIARIVGVRAPRISVPAPVVRGLAVVADFARAANIQLPGDIEGNQMRMSTYNIYYDTTKSREQLYIPRIDVTESVLDTYNWYRDNGYL